MQYSMFKIKLNNKTLIFLQVILVLFMLWFRDVLHFPSAITYISDVFLVLIVFQIFYKNTQVRVFKDILPQLIIFILIVVFMLFGAVINCVSPLLTVWGFRNNLRFFVFFFICASQLEISDLTKMVDLFKKIFWANLFMCIVQYYVFGLKNDYLGGFFGTMRGSNAYLNVFLCVVCSIVISDFLTSKMKVSKALFYVIAALYIAVLAELKVFYFEMVIMIAFAVISSKPSVKTVLITLVFIVGLIAGAVALFVYYPETFALMFDAESLVSYLTGTGYTSSGDLNRLTAINQISNTFFKDNILLNLFGFGLGSCEYSQFSFLQSDFSIRYGYLNYRWFTHAWVFLEQGAVGLILLVLFFISILIYVIKRLNTTSKYYMIIAIAFIPTCILGLFYNTAIQMESCYIIATMCAIPYISHRTMRLGANE